MSNQDLDGKAPTGAPPGAPARTPESAEQLLAKEREARALMRDRLRNTESLAAESHALRDRMAQELERVTAERDRLRNAASASTSTSTSASPPTPTGSAAAPRVPVEPTLTSADAQRMARAFDPPPQPPSRGGPWRALAMLGGLAVGVAALAWISGSLPGEGELAAASTSAPAPIVTTARRRPAPAASIAVAAAAPAAIVAALPPSGAVALPALSPEAQLAAAPTAAGTGAATATSGMEARLRAALDGEGIASRVDIDAATGHVAVADPQADDALRDRTDLVIRAVYAGANLPEPQIEHRWLSPMRGAHGAAASAAAPVSPALAYAARHVPGRGVTAEHRPKPGEVGAADADEPRPILPAGRVTAACKSDLAGTSTARRGASLMACMKHSCCSAVNRQTEECRAYDKAYPFTCSAN